jgi:hypothetical protein
MIQETTAPGPERVADRVYVTKADLRREFGLTDAQIARLAPADGSQPDPDSGTADLNPAYSRDRVEQWIAENREMIEAGDARRQALEERRARERLAAEARRSEVRQQIAALVRDSPVRELPFLEQTLAKVRSALNAPSRGFTGEANERAIFSHILENMTSYPELARMLNRLEAGFELSAAVRIYFCCQVVRRYRLDLDPMDAAFPTGARAMLPSVFDSGDPESVAAGIIGLDSD